MALMCQGQVSFREIEAEHPIVFSDYFAQELEQLGALVDLGAVEIDSESIRVTPLGWYVVRWHRHDLRPLLADRSQANDVLPGHLGLQRVQRNLQIGDSVRLDGWHSACADVDLHRRKNQHRHLQRGIAPGSHLDELRLRDAIMNMDISGALLRNPWIDIESGDCSADSHDT